MWNQMNDDLDVQECSSHDGVTVGMIDAIITLANALHERIKVDLRRFNRNKNHEKEPTYFSEAVQEAFSDLRHNKAVTSLLHPRDEVAMNIIHKAAASLKSRDAARS
jgi:hypothetical protein